MTEVADSQAQFKGLGFHQTLGDAVRAMVVEYMTYNHFQEWSWDAIRTVYSIVKHTFKFIRTEEGSEVVDSFLRKWDSINATYGRNAFEGTGRIRHNEAVARYDCLMEYLMDSGLIRPATREEAWEEAFIEAVEEKMEREE